MSTKASHNNKRQTSTHTLHNFPRRFPRHARLKDRALLLLEVAQAPLRPLQVAGVMEAMLDASCVH